MNTKAYKRNKRSTSCAMQLVKRRLPHVEVVVLTAEQDTKGFIPDFLSLRKRVFVDDMGWDIPHGAEFEAEQYDRADSVYVIAHDARFGGVMGGARLLNTARSKETGKFSYMIRDAYLGMLPGIPSMICTNSPPIDEGIWEMTRLVSFGSTQIGAKILQTSDQFLSTQRADKCLFLGSPAFMRMARSMGYTTHALGPIQQNEDGRFLAFSTDVLTDSFGTRITH